MARRKNPEQERADRELSHNRGLARKQSFEREREEGIDPRSSLPQELERVWSLALQLPIASVRTKSLPQLKVRNRVKGDWVSGTAFEFRHLIILTVGLKSDRASILTTLVHEVTHLIVWKEDHGPEFWHTFGTLASVAYGTTEKPTGRSIYDKHNSMEDAFRRLFQGE